MGILDLFRPKHRSSDIKVRLAAVQALSADDTNLLATIARTDKDPAVRRLAIEKLEEVDVLADIFERESDDALRDLAGSRAADIWVTGACQDDDPDLARGALSGLIKVGDQRALAEVASRAAVIDLRGLALAELHDPRALAEVAKSATSPELRNRALARLDDESTLRGLAIDTSSKELGLAAVDRLASAEILELVAQKAKNKAVRQRARRKIDEVAAIEKAGAPKVADHVLRKRAEKAQTLRAIDALADRVEWEVSLETVRTAEKTWSALGDTGEPAVDERFRRSVARYHAHREAAQRAVREREAELLAGAQAKREAADRAAADRAERAAARKAKGDVDDGDDGDVINLAAMAVLRPGPLTDEQKAEREAEFQRQREVRERRRAEDQARRTEEAATRAAREQEQAERSTQLVRSLGALLEDMTGLIGSTDGKSIDRLLGQAATAFGQLGRAPAGERDALETRYREVRGQLVMKLQDLREGEDWKRWANVPRGEELVAAAKELAEREEQPTLDILKELQKLWKEVGPLPQKKSQELWEQFKAHADAAFARIRTVRDEDKAKMGEHAVAREALIAEAETLADSTDWEATAAALKELQAKWKTAGPVPRKQGDELWQRFRAACDKFFERRKPLLDAQHAELEANLATKERLIELALAVVAKAPGERGWGADIGAIKDLQQEWKEIGHVPRAAVEGLWQRFRAACDGLFAKRDVSRDAETNARRTELDGLRAELDAVTAAATAGDGEAVARVLAVRRKVIELQQRDGDLGPELNDLLERMLRAVVQGHGPALRGTELDPVAMASKRSKLIGRASDLVPESNSALEAGATPATIAEQLKAAMSQNALFKGDGRSPLEVLEEIRAEWRAIGPVLGRDAERQAERFEEVCAEVRDVFGTEGTAAERRERGERRAERRNRPDRRRDGEAEAANPPAAIVPAPAPVIEKPAPVAVRPASIPPPVAIKPAPVAIKPAPVAAASVTGAIRELTDALDDEWGETHDGGRPAPAAAPTAPVPAAAPAAPAPAAADVPGADAEVDSGWE